MATFRTTALLTAVWCLAGSAADVPVRGGLVVCLGAEALESVAPAWGRPGCLIQGLGADHHEVTDMRRRIAEAGCYGRVSAVRLQGTRLPYPSGVASQVVMGTSATNALAEARRVLVPGGTLVYPDGRVETQPWPEDIDEWTHNLHDASNNAVASDRRVGPPKRLRWMAKPDHLRHHNLLASVSAMVSARGRLFAILDEGSRVSAFLPANWALVARDAFSGVFLWKRPISDWGPSLRNFRSGPAEIGRRLVAVGDRVYVTLGWDAPISVLDASTGETLAVLPSTEGAEEILVAHDIVLAVTGRPREQLRDWAGMQRDFSAGADHDRALVAVDAATRRLLWHRRDAETATVLPMTLAADGRRAFFVNEQGMNAIDLKSGAPAWQQAEPVAMQRQAKFPPTVVAHGGVVLYADRRTGPDAAATFYASRPKRYQARYRQLKAFPSRLRAYDAASGRRLWQCDAGESFHTPTDVLVLDGIVWYTASPAMLEGNFKEGRDLRTGEVVRTIDGPDINHGRCYRNRATTRYLLGGKNGIDFIDPSSPHSRHVPHGLRGTCQFGVLPCNGLLYLPPHACTCEATRKINGFIAVEAAAERPYPDPGTAGPRLVQGPAYGRPVADLPAPASGDWPTFRHDPARTGCATTTLPGDLRPAWRRTIGRRPTAAVCARGTLYVAARDEHMLWALDAETGSVRWTYRAGARIDSPPTVAGGSVVFGSRDGWLYCLCTDGEPAWRFRCAPEERFVVVHDQLESVWPLHGAPLVHDGKVYAAAGRGSILDGGVTVFCLDLQTGKVLNRARFGDEGGEETVDALLDVLSLVDGTIAMRSLYLTPEMKPTKPVAHLQSATGMLDDNFFHRSYWAHSTRIKRYNTGAEAVAGHLVVIHDATGYAYGRAPEFYLGHVKGFERHLYAADLTPERVQLSPGPRQPRRHESYERLIARYAPQGIATRWSVPSPVLVKGMTVTDSRLVVAGPAFELHPASYLVDVASDDVRLSSTSDDGAEAAAQIQLAHRGLREEERPLLCILDRRTGETQTTIPMESSPVFDGVIAAAGRLYVCREDGVVECLGDGL